MELWQLVAVVRDVARALGKPYALGDRISKMIPFAPGMTLDKAKEEQPYLHKALKTMKRLEKFMVLSYKVRGYCKKCG